MFPRSFDPSYAEGTMCTYRQEFEKALPRIQLHATIYFRSVKCSHKKEDFIAEALALAWKWWLRLRQVGKDPNRFVSAIAGYAAKAARSGRKLCGQEPAKDVLSPLAQQRHGFHVVKLPEFSTRDGNAYDEALHDNTVTPVDEQAAFRCDFPVWLQSYDQRRRDILGEMLLGERTQDLAKRFGVSAARISQLRGEFFLDWLQFTMGEV